jgi:hypothetical protein
MADKTVLVRWTFAWQLGQSEIIRCRTDLPGTVVNDDRAFISARSVT